MIVKTKPTFAFELLLSNANPLRIRTLNTCGKGKSNKSKNAIWVTRMLNTKVIWILMLEMLMEIVI